MDLPVKLVSKSEIKDKITVQAVDLPGMGNKPFQTTIDKGKDGGTLSVQFLNNRDNNQFRAGTYQFLLQAATKIGYLPAPLQAESEAAEEAKKKALAEADAAVKARDAAKKTLADAQAAGAETEQQKAEKLAAAEAALKAAEEAVKKSEAAKKQAEDAAKQAAERAKPRDAQVAIFSAPITVKLAGSPVTLAAPEQPVSVARGAKLEVPVGVQRLFGFADEVKISAKLPDGTKGIKAPEVAIAKDAGEGKLVIEASGDVAAGEHAIEIVAKVKFNGVDLESRAPAKLIVTES